MLKEKNDTIKDGREDDYSRGTTVMGVFMLIVGRAIRLNSKYNKDKWEFVAKEWWVVGVSVYQWMENY